MEPPDSRELHRGGHPPSPQPPSRGTSKCFHRRGLWLGEQSSGSPHGALPHACVTRERRRQDLVDT